MSVKELYISSESVKPSPVSEDTFTVVHEGVMWTITGQSHIMSKGVSPTFGTCFGTTTTIIVDFAFEYGAAERSGEKTPFRRAIIGTGVNSVQLLYSLPVGLALTAVRLSKALGLSEYAASRVEQLPDDARHSIDRFMGTVALGLLKGFEGGVTLHDKAYAQMADTLDHTIKALSDFDNYVQASRDLTIRYSEDIDAMVDLGLLNLLTSGWKEIGKETHVRDVSGKVEDAAAIHGSPALTYAGDVPIDDPKDKADTSASKETTAAPDKRKLDQQEMALSAKMLPSTPRVPPPKVPQFTFGIDWQPALAGLAGIVEEFVNNFLGREKTYIENYGGDQYEITIERGGPGLDHLLDRFRGRTYEVTIKNKGMKISVEGHARGDQKVLNELVNDLFKKCVDGVLEVTPHHYDHLRLFGPDSLIDDAARRRIYGDCERIFDGTIKAADVDNCKGSKSYIEQLLVKQKRQMLDVIYADFKTTFKRKDKDGGSNCGKELFEKLMKLYGYSSDREKAAISLTMEELRDLTKTASNMVMLYDLKEHLRSKYGSEKGTHEFKRLMHDQGSPSAVADAAKHLGLADVQRLIAGHKSLDEHTYLFEEYDKYAGDCSKLLQISQLLDEHGENVVFYFALQKMDSRLELRDSLTRCSNDVQRSFVYEKISSIVRGAIADSNMELAKEIIGFFKESFPEDTFIEALSKSVLALQEDGTSVAAILEKEGFDFADTGGQKLILASDKRDNLGLAKPQKMFSFAELFVLKTMKESVLWHFKNGDLEQAKDLGRELRDAIKRRFSTAPHDLDGEVIMYSPDEMAEAVEIQEATEIVLSEIAKVELMPFRSVANVVSRHLLTPWLQKLAADKSAGIAVNRLATAMLFVQQSDARILPTIMMDAGLALTGYKADLRESITADLLNPRSFSGGIVWANVAVSLLQYGGSLDDKMAAMCRKGLQNTHLTYSMVSLARGKTTGMWQLNSLASAASAVGREILADYHRELALTGSAWESEWQYVLSDAAFLGADLVVSFYLPYRKIFMVCNLIEGVSHVVEYFQDGYTAKAESGIINNAHRMGPDKKEEALAHLRKAVGDRPHSVELAKEYTLMDFRVSVEGLDRESSGGIRLGDKKSDGADLSVAERRIILANELLAKYPDTNEALCQRGLANTDLYCKASEHERNKYKLLAIADFERAIQLDPQNVQARFLLAKFYHITGQLFLAREYARQTWGILNFHPDIEYPGILEVLCDIASLPVYVAKSVVVKTAGYVPDTAKWALSMPPSLAVTTELASGKTEKKSPFAELHDEMQSPIDISGETFLIAYQRKFTILHPDAIVMAHMVSSLGVHPGLLSSDTVIQQFSFTQIARDSKDSEAQLFAKIMLRWLGSDQSFGFSERRTKLFALGEVVLDAESALVDILHIFRGGNRHNIIEFLDALADQKKPRYSFLEGLLLGMFAFKMAITESTNLTDAARLFDISLRFGYYADLHDLLNGVVIQTSDGIDLLKEAEELYSLSGWDLSRRYHLLREMSRFKITSKRRRITLTHRQFGTIARRVIIASSGCNVEVFNQQLFRAMLADKPDIAVIKGLLAKGASPDYCGSYGFSSLFGSTTIYVKHFSLLHIAVRKNRDDLVMLLYRYGANMNPYDAYSYTPMNHAVKRVQDGEKSYLKTVAALYACGADYTVTDKPYTVTFTNQDDSWFYRFCFQDHVNVRRFFSSTSSYTASVSTKSAFSQDRATLLAALIGQTTRHSQGDGISFLTSCGMFAARQTYHTRPLASGEIFNFYRIPNSGVDLCGRGGSCGFMALGITREQARSALIKNIDSPEMRTLIGLQIRNDFELNRESLHLSVENLKRMTEFYRSYELFQQERNTIISEQRGLCPELKDPGEAELIDAAESKNHDGKYDEIIAKLRNSQAHYRWFQQEEMRVLSAKGLILDYIENNILQEWMGVYVALAWAMVQNVHLRIWRHTDAHAGSKELYLLTSINHQQPHAGVIDILHTAGESHFERLHPTTIYSREGQHQPTAPTLTKMVS